MAVTLTQIREALAASLTTLQGIQVSAYLLANPTPPSIHIYPAAVEYDYTFRRGYDAWTLTVQAFVGLTSDIGAQKKLDELLAPSGTQSLKATAEADRTLGGIVDSVRVVAATGYHSYSREGGGPVLGAEWQTEIYATGA